MRTLINFTENAVLKKPNRILSLLNQLKLFLQRGLDIYFLWSEHFCLIGTYPESRITIRSLSDIPDTKTKGIRSFE